MVFLITGSNGLLGQKILKNLVDQNSKVIATSKGKNRNKDSNAEIETNKLVTISEFLSPIYFPKKPDIIEASNGKNNNAISMLSF